MPTFEPTSPPTLAPTETPIAEPSVESATDLPTATPTSADTVSAAPIAARPKISKPSPHATRRAPIRVALGQRTSPPARTMRDRALSLAGVWNCSESSGPPSKLTFTRKGNALELRNELLIAKKLFTVDETYKFDPASKTWQTSTQGNAYAGVASPWLGTTWTFDGSVPHGTSRAPVRMVYQSLGARTFRRAYERPENGGWTTFHAETCHRI